ncbi:tetratricopeptide repeat protein [Coleofasciculus sp. FACHB-712]|uniref:helix-turn-helix domain-containing protein n=1 Tax=Coleofasciculus sp. FACHB-712 TaxID=2692789 RepID=UPI001687F4A9|nr:helix-turn-helix domain-containing protein [Coleofasciculus sp. FACHB-712]MBD1945624.1 tetratricopeptide repeat protein [Coleofasciculus sp. FACHB-712]
MTQKRKPRGFFASHEGLTRLEAKRLEKGYTHEILAEKADVSLDRVRHLFNPHWGRKIQRDAIEKIARALNLHPADIVDPNEWNTALQTPEPKQISEVSATRYENIPRSGVIPKQFVGRSRELETLHQLLQQKSQVPIISAIAGMGGVGKTELAIQYAQQHLANYVGGVCWLPGKEPDMGIELVRFARSQFALNPLEDWDLKTQVDFCWRRWQSGDVLIVLDDVTDYERIQPYLPPVEPRFKVLMTTRIQRLGRSIQPLSLDVLYEPDALKLLVSLVGEERIQQELTEAKKLCAGLGYLPLGLELVGRYLDRKPDLLLAEMLQRLEDKGFNEKSLQKRDPDMTAKWAVKGAFELSWETLNDEAKQLGYLLSLFAPAPIPWKLVEKAAPDQDPEDLEEMRDDFLLNLHLLQRMGDGTYLLHQLIREFFREKLGQFDQLDNLMIAYCRTMVAVAKQIPEQPTREVIAEVSPAIPHVALAAKNLTNLLANDDLIWTFTGLGWFYQGQGLYHLAEPWLKQCLSVTESRLGSDHLQVATSLNNLALLYQYQGRYCIAEPLLVSSLELYRRLLGEENCYVALTLNNLANLYRDQSRYNEAEPLFLEALELHQRLPIQEHPPVKTMSNLALLYCEQGRYHEAEQLFLQALELIRCWAGQAEPQIIKLLNNLATLYLEQGRYSEAELLFLQALELIRCLFGENNPDMAVILNNLAEIYSFQGFEDKAETLFLQALELLQHCLGNNHPNLANSLNNLGCFYQRKTFYSEAKKFFEQALELRKNILGEDHADVAASLNNLAVLYDVQGSYRDAEPLYIQALAICEQRLGADYPLSVTVRKNLNAVRATLGYEN